MNDSDFEARLYELGQSTISHLSPPYIPLPKKTAGPRRLRTALLIAACAALLTAAALAVSLGWGEKLISRLGGSDSAAESIGGAMDGTQASAVDSGLTVTVRQTLTDRHCIYILCQIELPADMSLPDDAVWEDVNMALYCGGVRKGPSVFGCTGFERDGGKLSCVFSGTGPLSIGSGKTVSARLELKNLGKIDENGDFIPLVAGSWRLKWDYTFADPTREYALDVEGVPVTLELSPISIWAHTGGVKADYYLPHPVFDDGTVMDASRKTISCSPEYSTAEGQAVDGPVDADDIRSGKLVVAGGSTGYAFDEIIDLKNVKSVSLHGVQLPLD